MKASVTGKCSLTRLQDDVSACNQPSRPAAVRQSNRYFSNSRSACHVSGVQRQVVQLSQTSSLLSKRPKRQSSLRSVQPFADSVTCQSVTWELVRFRRSVLCVSGARFTLEHCKKLTVARSISSSLLPKRTSTFTRGQPSSNSGRQSSVVVVPSFPTIFHNFCRSGPMLDFASLLN